MECPFCENEVGDKEIRCPECGNPLLGPPEGQKEEGLEKPKELEGLFEDIFEDDDDEVEGDAEDPHVKAASIAQETLSALSEAKGLGVDCEDCEKLLDTARVAIANKHFNEAISLSQQAKNKLDGAREAHNKKMETVNRAQEVQELIKNAKDINLYTAEAEGLFVEAKALMGKKDYEKSLELLEKTQASLEDAKVYHKVIQVAKEVRDKLSEMSSFGLDISQPEEIFKEAKPKIETKDFSEALELLEKASEKASKLLLRRQLEQMELIQEDTSRYKKATGVFVLEEDDEEDEDVEEEAGDKPYRSAYKSGIKERKKMDKITDEYSRLRADFDNYRKNTEDRLQTMRDYANMDLIGSLLDVVDNFERGIKAYKTTEGDGDLDAFMEGMMNIRKQMIDILKGEKVSPIKCKGQEFDPFLHEAVSTRTSTDVDDNAIIEVVKRGYMYKDKVLRPAKVVINQYPEY